MTNQSPVDTIRDRAIKSSIWRNEGEKGAYYSVTLARTYKDDQGNLRDTNSFSQDDLLKLAEISRKSYHRINELKREHTQSRDDDRESFREKRQQREQGQRHAAPSRDY